MVNVKYKVTRAEIDELLDDMTVDVIEYDERTDGKDANTFFQNTYYTYDKSQQVDFIRSIMRTWNNPHKFESDTPKYKRGILYEFSNSKYLYDGQYWNLYLKILVLDYPSRKIVISLHMS